MAPVGDSWPIWACVHVEMRDLLLRSFPVVATAVDIRAAAVVHEDAHQALAQPTSEPGMVQSTVGTICEFANLPTSACVCMVPVWDGV